MGTKITRVPIIVSVVMLFLAIPPVFAGGYNIVLRFIVCGTAIYLANTSRVLKKKGWMWSMGAIAILFNPFFQVRLDRIDLVFVQVITVCLFLTSLVKVRVKSGELKLNMMVIKVALGALFFLIIVTIVSYCYFLKIKLQ